MNKYLTFLICGLLLCSSCNHNTPDTEKAGGFLGTPKPLNYDIEHIQTESYPAKIDSKVSYFDNLNFPDSLREKKKVYIEIRKNYFPGTRKIDFVDTAGYDVVIRNDSIKLFWFIDFEFDLKCTRIEEMTFEKHEFFIEEGKKIRRGLK